MIRLELSPTELAAMATMALVAVDRAHQIIDAEPNPAEQESLRAGLHQLETLADRLVRLATQHLQQTPDVMTTFDHLLPSTRIH